MIEAVLGEAGVHRSALAGVAVSAGPGSYTGLRIGVSVAKAIAEAMAIPLMAVRSLAAAAQAAIGEAPVLAAFPSRRGEVFAAAFRMEEGVVNQMGDTLSGDPAALLAGLTEQGIQVTAAVGPAAGRFESLLPIRESECSAGAIAELGARLLAEGRTVDAELFEPYYLKEFVAGIPTTSRFDRLPF